jgi:hypothetical protein
MNAFYDLGIKRIADGAIDLLTDDIQVIGVDSTYIPNYSTDEFEDDVSGFVGSAVSLSGKTTTAGRFLADNTTLSAVSGNAIRYLLIFKNTGSSATSPLIALIDTGINLPLTPNGSDILLVWDTGSKGIFKI